MSTFRLWLAGGIASVMMLAVVSVVAETEAHAAAGDIECTGTQVTTYNPGLLLTDQSVRVTLDRNYGPCVSISNPSVTGGFTFERRISVLSCLDVAEPGTGTRDIEWSTGQKSTYTYTRTLTTIGGQIIRTETGEVTSGLFAGSSLVQTTILATVNLLECLSPPGVTGNSGPMTLSIVPL